MAKLKERGVQLNFDKYRFRVTELEFLCYKIPESGIAPSDTKVDVIMSIRHRPSSTPNESEVCSFLGFAYYLNRYIPHLASLDATLREDTAGYYSTTLPTVYRIISSELYGVGGVLRGDRYCCARKIKVTSSEHSA